MTPGRIDDELLLIDFLLGQCDPPQADEVRRRLGAEEGFRLLHRNLSHALGAMKLLPDVEPPEDLAERTLRKVQAARKAGALAAARETARPWVGSTFSLREAVAVAAAVFLLAVLIVPSMRQARHRALRGQCASNMGQIGTAIGFYANENREYLPIATDQPYRWLPADGEPAVSNSLALFKLVLHAQAPPGLFQCPAVGRQALAVQQGMVDFPEARFVSYSYQHSLCPQGPLRRDRFSPAEQPQMVILADNSPLFEDGRFRSDRLRAAASDNHAGAGQNVLYLPGSVSWAERPTVGVGHNNIFLIDGVFDYRGDEQPAGRTDSFLLPAYSPRR